MFLPVLALFFCLFIPFIFVSLSVIPGSFMILIPGKEKNQKWQSEIAHHRQGLFCVVFVYCCYVINNRHNCWQWWPVTKMSGLDQTLDTDPWCLLFNWIQNGIEINSIQNQMEDQIGTVPHWSYPKEPEQAKSKDAVIKRNLDRIWVSAAATLPSNSSRCSKVSLLQKNSKRTQIKKLNISSCQTMDCVQLGWNLKSLFPVTIRL